MTPKSFRPPPARVPRCISKLLDRSADPATAGSGAGGLDHARPNLRTASPSQAAAGWKPAVRPFRDFCRARSPRNLRTTVGLAFSAVLFTFLFSITLLHAAPVMRTNEWKAVEDAIQKGLPQTAITNLNLIIPGALRDKAYGEAAKAIARRVVLEGNIQGNKPEEKISRMEIEIGRAPGEVKPLLQTVLATWYWHYFQNNRWRFMRRTATAEAPGRDFTTWDLPRLFTEIDRQFAAALVSADQLKRIPVATFDDLLTKGTLPDRYRPMLYDFIAHEALRFYTSSEQAAAKAEGAFELPAESPILGNVGEFMAWNPTTTDLGSPKLKAIRLYQQLLRFHEKDADVTAFVDADLGRLQFGANTAFGETRDTRYKTALQSLADRHGDHELSALARFRQAEVLQREEDFVGARQLAQRAVAAHRDSIGGRLARNLITAIEARSAVVTTEHVWNAPFPDLAVQYRNLTNVWFRAVTSSWSDFLDRRRSRPESLSGQERQALLARPAALAWSAALPPTTDYKTRTELLKAPTNLPPGFYFLIASYRADFSDQDNQLQFADFWVSDLAVVVRPRDGQIEGFVLEANSGEPLAGATVDAWFLDQTGTRVAVPTVSSDTNGFFQFPPQNQRGYLLRVRHNGRELASQHEFWAWRREPEQARDRTFFFTDRALYRPGQTIQYKGISLRVDPEQNNYTLLPGQKISIQFIDPNGKEVAKADHRCNDYGSFSGSFTAPQGRVGGEYRIHVTSGQYGDASFSVEEYKRPKFQVKLDAPKTAARLNDSVALTGHADAYTGAPIDGAKVTWRVVREVRWPDWWGWFGSWRSRQVGGSQEIAHGTATTGVDGTFQITFNARPDPKVSAQDEASFVYTVHADVTDPAGETRSDSRGVNVGFTALRANLTANDWQTATQPVEVNIGTTTLDGEPQVAEGRLRIHRLKEPATVQRPTLAGAEVSRFGSGEERPAGSDPNSWELGEVVAEKGFTTDAKGVAKQTFTLGPGVYRAMLESQDRFGRKVTARLPLHVLQPEAPKLATKIPNLLVSPDWSIEPGQEFMALWGTGYETGRAFVEVEHRGQFLQRFWTTPGRTQQAVKQAVAESMRGGFTLHVTQVRENRAYPNARRVDVPWSNKQLDLKWEHFTSKLGPAQQETWTAVVTGPKASKTAAEMVAALYDASLDQFREHSWINQFGIFRSDQTTANYSFLNSGQPLRPLRGSWRTENVNASFSYRQFPSDLVANFWGYQFDTMYRARRGGRLNALSDGADFAAAAVPAAPAMAMEERAVAKAKAEPEAPLAIGGAAGGDARVGAGTGAAAPKGPDLSQVTARRNLNETAFFFPKLLADSNGVVRLQFTMPEALTEWRFLGFAHDTALRSGFLEGRTVTSKDLMVQPNPPRFLREGDTLEFTVKVSNQSAARQQGTVRLTFADAATSQSFDRALGNSSPEQSFNIPAKESRTFSWRVQVPDGAPFLAYKAVGSTGRISDGEEGYLPILSRRIFVTESLPLPIRGPKDRTSAPVVKKFDFAKLSKSGRSSSLVHQNLVVQMVSNPSWYAVMALPYLMEFPHECSEQTFNRLYANALAQHIATSDPKIRRIFDQWKGTPALDSPLEKNQDLKAVALEETPWLRQANNESQARRNVGVLFDANRLNDETARTLTRLAEMQLPDGLWPWFPGGRGNDYITLYITTGFGRLRHLGVDLDVAPAQRALQRLDAWMTEHYERILEGKNPEDYVPSSTDALYLYGRSFFLKDRAVAPPHRKAIDFFLTQSRQHWLKLANRQSQGHLAIALKRWPGADNAGVARDIMKSIKERSVTNEEMGMFWRETELSWWWYRAPIETQALMIEAFDEVMGDAAAVEECRVWLLKQKQTQDWKTTKATADAVYGLLLRGRDILASDALVEVNVGGINVTPPRAGQESTPRAKPGTTASAPEAGTGFYEKRFAAAEIKPKLGEITVRKVDPGVAWGSVHWQYLEDMSKVTPYEGTPLKLKKSLFTRVNTKQGLLLEPVKGAIAVGDELVVRIELRVDRDMEYVHLKDQRGSGTEPVNVLSGYRYQDGLAYYENTRDTASHFFIDYLPKGVYVFEYATRVQHRGQYQTGMAEIQSMYAPEFNSHSESLPLIVR